MEYYDFGHVFEIYSKRKPRDDGQEHDWGKVREKLTEIIDAVGIDSRLLKQYRDTQKCEMVKFGRGKPQFCFPEKVCDFCVELILRYTSSDFKKIRAGDYSSVDPAVSMFLIDGFSRYLKYLGHDVHTIILERWKMDRRLHHHVNVLKSELTRACGELSDSAKKYEQFLGYEDAVYFLRHMVTRTNYSAELIEQIFSEYESARYSELADASVFSKSTEQIETSEDMFQTVALADALEQDEDYQRLLKKRDKILAEPGFKKGSKGRYNKITSELASIRRKYEIELFGESIPKETILRLNLKHPMEILYEAIMSVSENEQDRIEREEKEANLTEQQIKERAQALDALKQFYEKRGLCFGLSTIDTEEDEMFVNSSMNYDVKGSIIFPCCVTEKIVVYRNSSGSCAIKCPNCGKFSIIDFDKMVAETVSEIRNINRITN